MDIVAVQTGSVNVLWRLREWEAECQELHAHIESVCKRRNKPLDVKKLERVVTRLYSDIGIANHRVSRISEQVSVIHEQLDMTLEELHQQKALKDTQLETCEREKALLEKNYRAAGQPDCREGYTSAQPSAGASVKK
jgi:chromosome segregation ATPase